MDSAQLNQVTEKTKSEDIDDVDSAQKVPSSCEKGLDNDDGNAMLPISRDEANGNRLEETDSRPGKSNSLFSIPYYLYNMAFGKKSTGTNENVPAGKYKHNDQDINYATGMLPELSTSYKMDTKWRGYLVIINNKEFLPGSGYEDYPRIGTDADAEAMEKLFIDLGYTVQNHKNVGVVKLRQIFQKIYHMDFKEYSAFACVILSHGEDQDKVCATDGTIKFDDITSFVKGSNLAGKPKMFFLQMCRGNNYMENVVPDSRCSGGSDEIDAPGELVISVPIEADFLYAYSTVQTYRAHRRETGSWFIQEIAAVFRQYAHKLDVIRMLTRVCGKVAQRRSNTAKISTRNKSQVPSIVSQLRYDLYLKPTAPLEPLSTLV